MDNVNSITSISVDELQNKLSESDITLLDVRSSESYQNGHISQAQNVPLGTIESYNGNQDEEIYVICQKGISSEKAAHYLKSQGYNPINVKDGMSSWNGQVVKGN